MLFIFLFNIGGYYILYLGWHHQATTVMNACLDGEGYSEEETITLKIPFNLPYHPDQSTFKRVEGDLQHDGEFFKLVKQKVENDTLYVVCIKDHQEKKIFNFMADMAKTSADSPGTMKLLNSLIKDYVPSPAVGILSQQELISGFAFTRKQSFDILVRNYPVVSPPPELIF